MRRLLWLPLLICGCAGLNQNPLPTTVNPPADTAGSVISSIPEPSAAQKSEALKFDRFLQDKLSEKELKETLAACEKDKASSPFCFGYLGRDALNEKHKAYLTQSQVKRTPRVRPRFAEGKLKNWEELRADSVNNLLKAFSRMGASPMKQVKELALAEAQCPNNPAVALAARFEDDLPEKVDAGELALLYEKGGACLTNVDEKESVLTRAGLFYYLKKDTKSALRALQASADIEAAKSPRPLYWIYRIGTETSEKSVASTALKRLKERYPFSLHTVLARLAENEDPDDVLKREDPKPLARSRKVSELNPMIETAELLARCELRKSASKVLDWILASAQGAEPELRLYLVELKEGDEALPGKILALSRLLIDSPELASRRTLDLFFPKAFFPLFEKNAGPLDPYLLIAIARQESAFNSKAISSAKAKGLLQIIASGRVGRQLFDPDTNVKTGAKIFKNFLSRSEGRIHIALASYNAGPRRPDAWLKRYPTSSPMLFTDLIPYKETRSYVALILRNYYWYRRLYSPLQARLPWASLNTKEQAYWPEPPSTPAAVH